MKEMKEMEMKECLNELRMTCYSVCLTAFLHFYIFISHFFHFSFLI